MPDNPVRVLVANGPRLMRDLVLAVLADQPDIEVIGEIQNRSTLATTLETARPDVLIVGLDEVDKCIADCGFAIGRYPNMRILALAPEQNRGLLYWLLVNLRSKAVESSEAGLLSALRESPALGELQP
jgi:chemotaxis response regulator CheB